jgi:hypothetical protein
VSRENPGGDEPDWEDDLPADRRHEDPSHEGPLARPIPDTAPQTAGARRRACGSAKVWVIKTSELGINQAAPTLCATRAATRNVTEPATAHAAGQDEHRQADEKARASADPVGQRAGEKQQRSERDGISVDDPLPGRGRPAEVGADRPQRDVHDRRVEGDHQEPGRDRSQPSA